MDQGVWDFFKRERFKFQLDKLFKLSLELTVSLRQSTIEASFILQKSFNKFAKIRITTNYVLLSLLFIVLIT